MKALRVFVSILAIILVASLAQAATSPEKTPAASKVMSQKTLNANAWTIYTTNYGPFVYPKLGPGGFWGGPFCYIFGAGLWVGTITNAGDTVVAVGYNPSSGQFEFGPVDTLGDGDWEYYMDGSARVYLSTDPTDVSEWQIRDTLGNPIIESNQDSYARYNDLNPAFTYSGDSTLKVLVVQTSYAWNYGDLNDIIFFKFNVKNISGGTLNNVYIGVCADCDVGDESVANDRTTFDYTRNLAIQFQTEPEPSWPKTGVVGFRFLESPVNNTGDSIHIIDNQFPHTVAPGDSLGLTAFKVFTVTVDPYTDPERYLEMSGVNFWNLVADAYDEWGAETAGDKRFIMSSGPFSLEADSRANTCIAILAAWDTVALKDLSDTAQQYFEDGALGVFFNNDRPNIALHQLLPNTPNPFGHFGTTISYQIGGSGSAPVSLKIYNITGQLVKTLVNDNRTPGFYNAPWNGRSDNGQKVSAGIYIYRLQAGDKTFTKKMVLIK